jgi:hypothetical protein
MSIDRPMYTAYDSRRYFRLTVHRLRSHSHQVHSAESEIGFYRPLPTLPRSCTKNYSPGAIQRPGAAVFGEVGSSPHVSEVPISPAQSRSPFKKVRLLEAGGNLLLLARRTPVAKQLNF